MSDDINHCSTDEPVCPHCGKEQHDAWEWGDDETGQTDCDACGREFSYTRNVSIYWTTRKDIACDSCRGRGRTPNGKTCLVCSGSRSIPNNKP